MPAIMLGGIYGGLSTATEVVAVAIVYGIFIGFVVRRGLKIEKLWAVFRNNAAFIIGIMFIMRPAKTTGFVFAYLDINQIIVDFIFSTSNNYYVVIFMVSIIMLIAGMSTQTAPAIIILAPTLLFVVTQMEYDPVHFGIVLDLVLAIVLVTPPVTINLLVGSSLTGVSTDKITKAGIPLLSDLIAAFFVTAFIPTTPLLLLSRI